MLASLGAEPFDDPDWIYEPKYDGYRVLALGDGRGGVQLYSRNLLSFDQLYAPIREQLKSISHACLLDGEIVIEDKNGRSDFQLLQHYQKTRNGALKYYIFDLLNLDDNDTSGLPLLQRKELLELLLKKQKFKNIFYSAHIVRTGISYYKRAVSKKWEGIMAKRADSIYQPGRRSQDWIKLKITNEEEAVIGGITEPQGSRRHFGSLLLGAFNKDKDLIYTGKAGTGFDTKELAALYGKFKLLFTDKSPFANAIKLPNKIQWLKPKLVCQVKFTEWTDENSMRHPVYMGLRQDKKPEEVTREKPSDMTKTNAQAPSESKKATIRPKKAPDRTEPKSTEVKVGKAILKLTNSEKIYWPGEGITKGDLVHYYSEIAPVILPYLKDRPESMHRFPNGISAPAFYQKDLDTKTIPDWVHSKKVFSESNNENINYLICNDRETLMYMANLGCIEINPWNSRLSTLEKPDWLVIDLDPEEIPFTEVVKCARAAKKVFDKLELDCYCKTSGATGLHIFSPLGAKYEYNVVRNFAQLIARHIHDMLPATTSLERLPKNRKGKIYIDFLQNSKGQTLASPYSVRLRPGATVSTPLEWTEVNAKLDPKNYTIKNTMKRLDKKGDLWTPVMGKSNDLRKALKIIESMS